MTNDVKLDDLRDRRIFDAVCRMAQSGDRLDLNLITRSYVDMGHIDRLKTQASQYIEGRRGTGKTHLLTYFAQLTNATIKANRQIAVYIDARELLGETPEASPPPKLYGQKLLQQMLIRIAHELRIVDEQYLFHNSIPVERSSYERSVLLQSHRILSDLQCAASNGTAVAAANGIATDQKKQQIQKSVTGEVGASVKSILDGALRATADISQASSRLEERRYEFKIDHTTIRQHIDEYLKLNDLGTLHVIIDEWSSLSANVQPHFAEYIKRCLFPLRSISVKIGVIPFQTHFHTSDEGQQIGFERNGDIFRALNLDEDLVYYGTKCPALKKSFTQLLAKHIAYNAEAAINPQGMTGDEDDYVHIDLESIPQLATGAALDKLLLFSMGNPRDFLNLFRRDRSYSSPNHAGERFVVVSIDFCIIVEHLKSPNYRNVWASNAQQIEQLKLFSSDEEPPAGTSDALLSTEETVRVLQSPDKRTARYVVLPDSIVGGPSDITCSRCGERFVANHPIVVKFRSCPKCAEPVPGV